MDSTIGRAVAVPVSPGRWAIAVRRIAIDLALGALGALITLAIRLKWPDALGDDHDALFLIPAALCAWRRGFRCGAMGLLCGGLVVYAVFLAPDGVSHGEMIDLAVFLLEGTVIISLVAFSRRRLQVSERNAGQVQQEFATLLDGVSDFAFFLLDSKASVSSWNSGAARLTMFEREAMIGQRVTSLCDDESTSSMQRALELAVHGGSDQRDMRIRRSDGTAFCAEVTVVALRDDQDNLRGYSIVIRDITAVRLAQKALRESEERYRLVVTNIPDVAWATDSSGRTLYISDNFESITGYTKEDLYERPHELWFGCVHPDDLPRVQHAFEMLFNDGSLFDIEYRYRRSDGEWIWLHDRSCTTYDVNGVPYAFGLFGDVTVRRNEQEQLKRYERLLAEAERVAHVGSWSREFPSNKVSWSEETYRIFGAASDAFDGTLEGMLRWVHPEDLEPGLAAARLTNEAEGDAQERIVDIQGRIIRPDGEQRIVRARSRLLRDDLGRPLRVVGTVKDVTERVMAQERERKLRTELENAQRLSELGRVAANIAHEVNNVLMAIHPQAELADRAAPGNRHVQAAAARIRSAIARGRRITEEILRFTHPREPEILDIDARQWLQGVVDEVRSLAPPHIEVVLQLPKEPVIIQGDQAQLQQVVLNLCSNARNAMAEGGVMTIRLDKTDSGFVEVTVADTGVGIAPHLLPRIFETLFTAAPSSGSGLGLAVARQIVGLHGGTLDAVSNPGAGSRFMLRLPVAEPRIEVAGLHAEVTSSAAACRRLLLVEDDDAVSCGISTLLEMEGIEVQIAREGGGVVQAIHDFSPDAIVLDVTLPDISGIEVFEAIRKIWPLLPIIISTGQMCDPSVFDLERQPHTEFLMKPYASAELLDRIGRTVGS